MDICDNFAAKHLLDYWAPQQHEGLWWVSTVKPPMLRICAFKRGMPGDESGHYAASIVCKTHNIALQLAKVDVALAKPLPVSNTRHNCVFCGGTMVGDDVTQVLHCEYASDELYDCVEPDGGPIYCGKV